MALVLKLAAGINEPFSVNLADQKLKSGLISTGIVINPLLYQTTSSKPHKRLLITKSLP